MSDSKVNRVTRFCLGVLAAVICLMLLSCLCNRHEDSKNEDARQQAKIRTEQGLDYQKANEPRKALKAFEEAVAIDPTYSLAHARLGWAHYQYLEFDKAEAQFQAALQLDPNCKEAYLGVGYLKFMAGEYDQAMYSFKRAIVADPELASAHAALGRVFEKQGLPDEAIVELEEAVRLNPDETMSYWVLSKIYETKGLSEKAEQYRAKALSRGGDSIQFERELTTEY